MGRRSTISTSNIKKITANKKNRREKGIRADWFGSNPHSNGEVFSRSFKVRIFKVQARRKIKRAMHTDRDTRERVWVISLRR